MKRSFLPLLILSLVACCIEVDISVPGFPAMAAYFGVSEGMIQLTIAYNFLGFCVAGLLYGPLSECFGRRRMMIVGNALLMLGAVGCVFAPTIEWLLAVRFVQGVGASASAVVAFAMIGDAYEGDARGVKYIGIMNSVLTILMAIAPVLGGFINEAIGWRGNYTAVAVVSAISWIFLLLFLPETKRGFELFSPMKVLSDYKKLFFSPKFMNSSIVPSLLSSAYMSFVACGSFLYMGTFGLPTIGYALHQGSILASFSFLSLFSGRIVERFGKRNCVVKGTGIMMAGSVGMVALSLIDPNSPYLLTSFMILFCLGFAICYPVIFALSLEVFPDIKGTASSAIMGVRAFLISAFVAITSYLYDGRPITISLIILMAFILGLVFTINLVKSGEFSEDGNV